MKNILAAVLILVIAVFSLTGCQTAKGATTGMALTAEGAVQDTASLWGALMSLDQWMRKNMW